MLDRPIIERCDNLKLICVAATGVNNIDVDAATQRGIPVTNTPGVLTETTADLAFALLMAVARRLPEGYDYVREDRWLTWGPLLLLGKDIHGATLGIVGFGRIGREMARRAQGFGMRTIYYSRTRAPAEVEAEFNATYIPFDQLLADNLIREGKLHAGLPLSIITDNYDPLDDLPAW